MSKSKNDKMTSFWSERAKRYGVDPRANTNDIWLREIEISHVNQVLQENSYRDVMDFGCANGYSTARLAKLNQGARFAGIDINPDMINIARKLAKQNSLLNLEFMQLDILREPMTRKFDFVYAMRAFQNLESFEMQIRIFDKIFDLLNPNGAFLYIESYADGYTRLNEDRMKLRLAPLPIHEHLTLLTDDFDGYVASKLKLVKKESLSSSYYLITRLLYSYIAKMNNEPIDYNHPIHQVAAIVPQIGEYGPQRANLFKKV